jgi:transcription elongation factor Elf1
MENEGEKVKAAATKHSTCPHCGGSADHVPTVSANTALNYYHCEQCGHVWAIPKPAR